MRTLLLLVFFGTSFTAFGQTKKEVEEIRKMAFKAEARQDFLEQELHNIEKEWNADLDNKLKVQERILTEQKESIDQQKENVEYWVAILSIVITLIGLYLGKTTHDHKKQQEVILNEILEQRRKAEDDAKSIADKKHKADAIVNELEKLKDKASYANLRDEERSEAAENAKWIEQDDSSSLYQKACAKALSLYFSKRYTEAIAQYINMLSTFKDDITLTSLVDIYFYLGSCFEKSNQHDEAIKFYEAALLFNPNFYRALYNIGNIKLRENNLPAAIKFYDEALKYKPDDIDILNNKGNTYFRLEQYDLAIQSYLRALQFNKDSPKLFVNLGAAYDELKHYDQALTCYESAIEIKSDFIPAWYNKIELLLRLNNFVGARSAFENFTKTGQAISFEFCCLQIILKVIENKWAEDLEHSVQQVNACAKSKALQSWSLKDLINWCTEIKSDVLAPKPKIFIAKLLSKLDSIK